MLQPDNLDELYDLDKKSIATGGEGRASILSKMARSRKSAVFDRNPFFKLLSKLVQEQAIDLDLDTD